MLTVEGPPTLSSGRWLAPALTLSGLVLGIPAVWGFAVSPWALPLPPLTLPLVALVGTCLGGLLAALVARRAANRDAPPKLPGGDEAVGTLGAAKIEGRLAAGWLTLTLGVGAYLWFSGFLQRLSHANVGEGGSVVALLFLAGVCGGMQLLIIPARGRGVGGVIVAVALAWLLTAGIHPLASANALYQRATPLITVVLVISSITTIGLAFLREDRRTAAAAGLVQRNAVLWPVIRTLAFVTLAAILCTLIPLGIPGSDLVAQTWNRVFGHGQYGVAGPGVAHQQLGNTVDITDPAPVLPGVVLRYHVDSAPPFLVANPPLMLTSFDQFDGHTWGQGTTKPVTITGLLPVGKGAATLRAHITVEHLSESLAWVPGLTDPLGFSLPSQAQTLGGGGDAPTTLSVVGWQAPSALTKGTHYSMTSLVIDPAHLTPVPGDAVIPPSLTTIPGSEADAVKALARQWGGDDTTLGGQIDAIETAMRLHLHIDGAKTPAPAGDPVLAAIANGHGNSLALNTLGVLLLRARGIPARLAVGYGPGECANGGSECTVAGDQVAVWVQVATAQGWLDRFPIAQVTFLPGSAPSDASASPTATPQQAGATGSNDPTHQNDATKNDRQASAVLWLLALLVVALIGAVALLVLVRRRASATTTPQATLHVTFSALGQWARRWGAVHFQVGDTMRRGTAKVSMLVGHEAELNRLVTWFEDLTHGGGLRVPLAVLAATTQQVRKLLSFWGGLRTLVRRRAPSRSQS